MTGGSDGRRKIDAYLQDKDARLRELARGLRKVVVAQVPEVTEGLNSWGIPTFYFHGDLCYFMVGKNHVTFGFPRGTSLTDPKHLLEGTGKGMRHVKLRKLEDLEREGLRQLIDEAARTNEESPPARMRSARKSAARGRSS